MNRSNGTSWLRPTALVVVSLAISILIAFGISLFVPETSQLDQVDRLANRVSGLKRPSADLTPEDVVRIQLAACCA